MTSFDPRTKTDCKSGEKPRRENCRGGLKPGRTDCKSGGKPKVTAILTVRQAMAMARVTRL